MTLKTFVTTAWREAMADYDAQRAVSPLMRDGPRPFLTREQLDAEWRVCARGDRSWLEYPFYLLIWLTQPFNWRRYRRAAEKREAERRAQNIAAKFRME